MAPQLHPGDPDAVGVSGERLRGAAHAAARWVASGETTALRVLVARRAREEGRDTTVKRSRLSGGAAPPLALILCLILAACGGASAPASSAPPAATSQAPAKPSAAAPKATAPSASAPAGALTGPAAVAGRWFDLVNRGDTSGLATLFTDDAVYIGGPPCGAQTFCKGPAAIAKAVESYAASHTTLTPVGTPQVAGNLVFLRFEVRNDVAKEAGVERELMVVNAVVLSDRLAAFVGQPDLSDAQTVTLRLHQQVGGSAPAASPTGKTDPTGVIQRYVDALNRGDPNIGAATFADGVVNITPNPTCGLRSPCTSAAASSKVEQTSIAAHQKITRVGDWRVAGELVQVVNEARSDTIAAQGVDRVRAIVTWQVVGDRVVSRVNLQDLSDPETVKRQLLQQAQASASGTTGPAASATAPTASHRRRQPQSPSRRPRSGRVKNWDLTVADIERRGNESVWSQFGNKSTAAGTWIVVVVDMKNTGNQNFGVNTSDFQLKDGNGTPQPVAA